MSSGTPTMRNIQRKRKILQMTLSDEAREILDKRRGDDTRSGFVERLIREGQFQSPRRSKSVVVRGGHE